MERALFVAGLLSGGHIEKEKFSVESRDERDLIVVTPNNTAEPRNRRAEVTICYSDDS